MNAIDRAMAAARREAEISADLDVYLRNVRLGRTERDDEHEQRLRGDIAEAEREWRDAMAERRREREAV
jgi:hypothetical protein